MSGYWYLATVYSKHRIGIDAAFAEACRYAAVFMRAGVPVFCPIAHTHPVAMAGHIDPLDAPFWIDLDRPLMDGAAGLVVVAMDGFLDSVGIAIEIEHFERAGKPVFYWTPGEPLPPYFLSTKGATE